jgi:catechol 2,3-dioxygenase-like lactoylglutathione lyase family enzyme
LESHGEGINHIAFIVDDIEEATSIMVEAGFKVISSSKNEGGGGMAFLILTRSTVLLLRWRSYHLTLMKIHTGALNHGANNCSQL